MPNLAVPEASDQVGTENLPAVLDRLGSVLLSTETIGTTIDLVTLLASETITATAGAGLTLLDRHGQRSMAASNPLVEQADQMQYDLDEGPCLAAGRNQATVRIDDVTAETRWPRWCAPAAELGLRSMLSVPLVAGGTVTGAIKVYSHQRHAYDDARVGHVLSLFARQAAILLANSQALADAREASGQLTAALANRDIIGQAKGVLIAQGALDDDVAFAMLASASQRSNLRLPEVARQVVESVTGRNAALPPVSRPRKP